MKKILTLSICVFLLTGLGAQTNAYKPFPTKNAIWVNQRGEFFPDKGEVWSNPDYFSIDGRDTVINGLTYSQVMYNRDLYHGAIRDDKGKVYYIPAKTTKDLLVYDFTVHKGDGVVVYSFNLINKTNKLESSFRQTCTATDSVLINGSYRRRINFGPSTWIEGIGNTRGLFVPTENCTCYHDEWRLICMSENDTRIFPSFALGACPIPNKIPPSGVTERLANSRVELFPNPTTGKFRISIENDQPSKIEIIDLLGQVIFTSQSKSRLIDVDISDVRPGIYYVRTGDANNNSTLTKIIKQ